MKVIEALKERQKYFIIGLTPILIFLALLFLNLERGIIIGNGEVKKGLYLP